MSNGFKLCSQKTFWLVVLGVSLFTQTHKQIPKVNLFRSNNNQLTNRIIHCFPFQCVGFLASFTKRMYNTYIKVNVCISTAFLLENSKLQIDFRILGSKVNIKNSNFLYRKCREILVKLMPDLDLWTTNLGPIIHNCTESELAKQLWEFL